MTTRMLWNRGFTRIAALFVSFLLGPPAAAVVAQEDPASGRPFAPRAGLVPPTAVEHAYRYHVNIQTRDASRETRPFRTGVVLVRRDSADPALLLTTIDYFDGEKPTGSFEIVQDASSLAMQRFEYQQHSVFGMHRKLRVEGMRLFGDSRMTRERLLSEMESAVFAPENKEIVLAFADAEPGEVLAIPLAGFGEPPVGTWRVRFDGEESVALGDRSIQASRWTGLGRPMTIHIADRAPYVLRFELTDQAGTVWIHEATCVSSTGNTVGLPACGPADGATRR